MKISTMLSPNRCPGKPSAFFSFSPFNPQRFVSFQKSSSLEIPVSIKQHRYLCMSSSARSEYGPQRSSIQGGEAFFRSVLEGMESVYLNRNSTAKGILDLVESADKSQICYDHLAFRTFGVIFCLNSPSFLHDSTILVSIQISVLHSFVKVPLRIEDHINGSSILQIRHILFGAIRAGSTFWGI